MPDEETRNKGGRPRVALGDRWVRTYVALRPAEYDRLARKALSLKISIAKVIRSELGRP